MTTSGKNATGLSVTAVAGVLAYGFVLLFAPAGQPADIVAATPAAEPVVESTPDVELAEATESAEPADPFELPDGYVDVGHGEAIPAGGHGDCEASAYIWIGSDNGEPVHAEMEGADLVDMGPQEMAMGTVEPDEQGRPLMYTVAPGDVLAVIGYRFCLYYGGSLALLNNYPGGAEIQPGDVLILNADYATDFVYPY
ncbi:LysM peptidoglycan-binding domain-containing protein [Labedella endophytica]|uniref:LysM domain-containing protein n=1 Tax=Labedella endophytica TaxID=1523160 RepID=A0A433JS58_9MICO|nr:LysM domain-containing protein [Labedella endophytica]RUR01208.1 LysM domain-containing protein [Labedella endophytica]